MNTHYIDHDRAHYRSDGTIVEVAQSVRKNGVLHRVWVECVPPYPVLVRFLEHEKRATLAR